MTHPTQTADLADLRRQLDTETAARQIAETTAANALDLIPAEILMDLIADAAPMNDDSLGPFHQAAAQSLRERKEETPLAMLVYLTGADGYTPGEDDDASSIVAAELADALPGFRPFDFTEDADGPDPLNIDTHAPATLAEHRVLIACLSQQILKTLLDAGPDFDMTIRINRHTYAVSADANANRRQVIIRTAAGLTNGGSVEIDAAHLTAASQMIARLACTA